MKKKLKLLASMLAIATFALFITSCDKDDPAPKAEVTGVTIVTTPNSRTLAVNDTVTLTAKVDPAGAETTLTWESSSPSVVTVAKTGDFTAKVTAKAVSETEITITVKTTNEKTATFKVTKVEENSIELKSIAITPRDTTLLVNGTITYTATPSPAGATNYSLIWSSSNATVATIDGGLVTAVNAGTAYIKVASGNIVDSVLVTVNATSVPLASIEITPGDTTLLVNGTVTYTATLSPAGAPYDPVWSSGNTAVATVSATGLVTAVSEGTAYIKVAASNIADSVLVTVATAVASKVKSIEAKLSRELPYHEVSTDRHVLVLGDTITLFAIPSPANAIDYELRWESHHPDQVSVDDNGVVTAVGVGPGNIFAVSGSGDDIIISNPIQLIVVSNLSDITLSPAGESHTIYVGSSMKITASPVPEDPYDGYTPVWSSSNSDVATVDNNGVITAHTVGTATITVTSSTITKSIEVKVEVYESSIDANGKYSTNGWTAESRGGNHAWYPDGGPDEDAGAPKYAIDGDRRTGWHSSTVNPLPQCFVVDMKASIDVDHIKISHIPDDEFRQDEGKGKNWIYYKTIQVYLSDTYVDPNMEGLPESLGSPVASLDYVNATNSAEDIATIDFGATGKGRYLILFFPDSAEGPYISFAEVEVYKNL